MLSVYQKIINRHDKISAHLRMNTTPSDYSVVMYLGLAGNVDKLRDDTIQTLERKRFDFLCAIFKIGVSEFEKCVVAANTASDYLRAIQVLDRCNKFLSGG